jgi:hypothetical protein
LSQHPDIASSPTDSIRYFDNLFHRGETWYHSHFPQDVHAPARLDPTPSYVWSPHAPQRIVEYNPKARVIIGLRNPVERAFSHYWHVRKQDLVRWRFDQVLDNANMFEMFLQSSFVSDKIKFFQDHLPDGHVHLFWFDDLSANPAGELWRMFEFAQVDPKFQPALLHRKVNVAGARQTLPRRALNKLGRVTFGERFEDLARRSWIFRWMSGKEEYLDGVPASIRPELIDVYRREIDALERITGACLDAWRK